MSSGRRAGWIAAGLAVSGLVFGTVAGAQEGTAEEAAETGEAPAGAAAEAGEARREAPTGTGPAPVDLDALLKLPSGAGSTPEPADSGAAERRRWQARFADRRESLDRARRDLSEAQQEIEKLAAQTDNWQMAAPGGQANAENSPVSYKLRQEIRGLREDVAREERLLRELEVEASLAGVPAEWREPIHEDATPGS